MKLFWAIIKITGIACVLVAIVGYLVGKGGFVLEYNNSALPLIDGEVAVGLSIVGILLFIPGFLLEKRSMRKDQVQTTPSLDINDLLFIERAIKRTRRRNYLIGIFLVVFSAFMIWIPFVDPEADPSSGGSIFLYCFAGLIGVLGAFMVFKAMKISNVQDSDIYKTIMFEPKTITGLDAQVVRSAYTKHSSSINAHLFISTKKITVLAVNETELELLRQYLVRHNPNLVYNVTESRVH